MLSLAFSSGFCHFGVIDILQTGSTRWRCHSTASQCCVCVCRSGSSSFPISTNHNVNIKAEPLSPPRDLLSQPGYMPLPHSSTSTAQAEVGRSPADSVSSSCSSHEGGSEREEPPQRPDFHSLPEGRAEGAGSPTMKRMRLDSWVT